MISRNLPQIVKQTPEFPSSLKKAELDSINEAIERQFEKESQQTNMISNTELEDISNFTRVPCGKIPLFGDKFHDINAADREKYIKVYDFEGKDYILTKSYNYMQKEDFLDLNESDCIYGSQFSLMIKEAFRDDKNFIVARLKSRASDKFENKLYSIPKESK